MVGSAPFGLLRLLEAQSVSSVFSCSFGFGVNRGDVGRLVLAWALEVCVMGWSWVEGGWVLEIMWDGS